MPGDRTSCVHRGNTFFGEVALVGTGPETEVRVRYNGGELSSRAGGQPIEVLAPALLRELVVLEAIGTIVTEATRPGALPLTGSDAVERRAPRAA